MTRAQKIEAAAREVVTRIRQHVREQDGNSLACLSMASSRLEEALWLPDDELPMSTEERERLSQPPATPHRVGCDRARG